MAESVSGPQVLAIGPVFLDVVSAVLDRLPEPGEEMRIPAIDFAPGGYAIAATALARLGLCTALGSPIGADPAGALLRALLEPEGALLPEPSAIGTPVTLALNHGGDRGFLTARWPRDEDLLVAAHQVLDRFPQAPMVHLSGSGAWSLEAARRVRREGRFLSIDTGTNLAWLRSSTFSDVLSHADAYLPNQREAMAVSGANSVEEAAADLGRRVPLLVIKLGREGALTVCGGEVRHHPVEPREVRDATGAGDVFDAGFITGLHYAFGLSQAVELGQFAAGRAIGRLGGATGAPTLAEAMASLPHLPWPRGDAGDGDAG